MRWFSLLTCSAWLAAIALAPTPAASLEIDSFDDGTFAFSHDQSATRREVQQGAMLGDTRIVGLTTSRRPTTVSASAASGQLAFDTGSGAAGGLNAGRMTLTYGTGFFDAPADALGLDLSDFDRFLLDVVSLQGEGTLSVYVNAHAFSGPLSLPITSVGTLDYDFALLNVIGDLSNVDNIDFLVTGVTTDFTIVLGGIQVVPEPGTLLLVAFGLVVLGARRTKRACRAG